MPTYEYRCNECGHELEAFQKITEPALKLCPNCQKEALERLISGGNFVLKGGGWYKDLYSSSKKSTSSDGKQADKIENAIKKSENGKKTSAA
jgi:putative FmdB family regulatory protein